MAKVSIIGQIAEVEREIALRQREYPGQVRAGKMRQGEADLLIDRMRAVLATLLFCQQHEGAIREYVQTRRSQS